MVKFCSNCGEKALDNDRFCKNCGFKLESQELVNTSNTNFRNEDTYNQTNNQVIYVEEKSPIISLILSFFIWGLGYAYIGDVGKFLLYFIIGILLGVVTVVTLGIGAIIFLIVFIYQLYAVYKDTEKYNLEKRMMY